MLAHSLLTKTCTPSSLCLVFITAEQPWTTLGGTGRLCSFHHHLNQPHPFPISQPGWPGRRVGSVLHSLRPHWSWSCPLPILFLLYVKQVESSSWRTRWGGGGGCQIRRKGHKQGMGVECWRFNPTSKRTKPSWPSWYEFPFRLCQKKVCGFSYVDSYQNVISLMLSQNRMLSLNRMWFPTCWVKTECSFPYVESNKNKISLMFSQNKIPSRQDHAKWSCLRWPIAHWCL